MKFKSSLLSNDSLYCHKFLSYLLFHFRQLKARRTVEAKDCDGKIRYPHYTTNADDFQLISGARNLSVYYVNLAENTKGHVIAAHTFCSKCGVHILRAPNSNSKRLEVNTNCLDDKRDVKEIRVEGDLSGMSLSSGNALENRQRSPRPASIHEDHEENSLWMQDEDFLQSMSRDTSKLIDQIGPGTPATLSSSTLLPSGGSVFSAASSIADDYDDVSTLRSSEAPSTIHSHYNMRSSSMSVNAADDHYITRNSSMSVGAADTYYKTRSPSMGANNSDAASIRTWAVGSDNSISPHSASILPPSASSDGISLPSMPFDKRPNVPKRAPPSSAVMKEQLQYYMKKHLVSSKSADADSMEETKDLTEGIST